MINGYLSKGFVMKEELLQLIYFLEPLMLLFVAIIFIIAQRSVLDWAIRYLIVANNFTLAIVVVVVALVIVKLIFFICVLSFLFLIVPLILELSMSMHPSFQVSSFLIVIYRINYNQLDAWLGNG